MKPVCVITGGGSGMGRATAKLVCEAGYHVILVGRTAAKLERAVAELTEAGHEAEAFACDLSDRASCEKLARHAVERGQVKALLHIAGMSPHMGSPEAILRANALGTVNINDAFYPVMAPGGCVIDTSSMSAYLSPSFIMPKRVYPLARTDREKFFEKDDGSHQPDAQKRPHRCGLLHQQAFRHLVCQNRCRPLWCQRGALPQCNPRQL